MAVIVNTIEESPTANSFVSAYDAGVYYNQSLDYDKWEALTADNKARYLIAASDIINKLPLKQNLYKKNELQSLNYPLIGEIMTSHYSIITESIVKQEESLLNSEIIANVEELKTYVTVKSGSYTDAGNYTEYIIPDDWILDGKAYTHISGEMSKIELSLNQTKIVDYDILAFSITIENATAGTLTIQAGTMSPEIEVLSTNGTHVFTLAAQNTDKIFFKASADFDGSFIINYIRQTDLKYSKFIYIEDPDNVEFKIGERYKLHIENVTGSALKIYDGVSLIATIEPNTEPIYIERIAIGQPLIFANENMNDMSFNFQIEHIHNSDSKKAAIQATMLQTMWLVKNRGLIEQAQEGRITGYIKEGYGHGTNEKAIANTNPFSRLAPGVASLMKPYVKFWIKIGRI